jgi:hypothetical protein
LEGDIAMPLIHISLLKGKSREHIRARCHDSTLRNTASPWAISAGPTAP